MMAKGLARPDRSKMRGEGQGKETAQFKTKEACQSQGLSGKKSCFHSESR